jgi:polyferredoxin
VGCCLGRVGVEVFVSRILCVLGAPYAVIYKICADPKKKKKNRKRHTNSN